MMDLMAYCGAESSRKNEFSSGVRVLAVDDDIACLKLLETLLKRCGYEVTIAQHAITALGLLRENKDNYDIVISDVQMPEMDGFQLLEVIGLEMNLPVIMLSVNGETSYVMKGVLHGAVDYLVKPVRIEDLKLIWKHVIKKSLIDKKGVNNHGHSNILEKKADNDQYLSASSNCTDQTNQKEDYATENTDGELSKHKRPRVSWSTDLRTRFIKAVSQLGFDEAVPKRILELMNVQGITRENVASHLQKYRKTLKKNGIGLNQQYHADPAIHRLCVDSSSSVILSFKEEARAKGVSPAKHSLGDCQKDSTILSSVSSQDSYKRTIPSPFQQCSSFSTAGVRTRYVGHSTNSLGLERANPSLGVNSLNRQALTSISKQVDEYSHDFYQNRWSGCGNLYPVSSCEVVQRLSYQDSFDAVDSSNAGLNDSAELNCALPHFDMTAETSGDILSTLRYDAGNASDTCHTEFRKGQSEDSSIDTLFNFNRCNSADDLNTILNQFQQ